MKLRTHLQSLIRSPLKTLITLLLLGAAAFLFLYNLSEYSISDREYREARDKYEGVLTVEERPVPESPVKADFFLLTDETGRNNLYGELYSEDAPIVINYDNYHQKSLDNDLIEKLGSLPHISRVEKRYLAAGVSPEYYRLDTDHNFYYFAGRCILAATVKERIPQYGEDALAVTRAIWFEYENFEHVILGDAEMLAGDPAWFWDIVKKQDYQEHVVDLKTVKEEYRGERATKFGLEYNRDSMFSTEYHVFDEDTEFIQPGRRLLMVLRNCHVEMPTKKTTEDGRSISYHSFNVGDDSLIGWWPYFTDITDLPENWLDMDEFADLRELIRVTNDDVHTFDVVFGDDMAAQRRVSENRLICEEGRFITPADAGKPVCVVSTDFLEMSGLKVGDTVTLDLGNYLSEQYAPLGAVASTRGRQNTAYTEQTFTIIGSWRDLNEGKHIYQDWFWCWSNNAIFVPSAFLPECRNAEDHGFKPSEVSFVVGNAEEIDAFVKECLPQVEAMGLTYVFSDGGWLQIGESLMQSRRLALVKLLIFSGAALFALILTVWLFIGRKKREYGILRALGMPKGEAGNRLYIPFLILGLVSAVLGLAIARIVTARQLAAEAAHAPASIGLFLLGALGFLALLALVALAGLLLIRRKSILELVQEKQR